MIKEVIVVEGRDDITVVKAAVDAEVIATRGFGYNKKFIKNLQTIAEKRGIIILTDPDYMGEKIRKDIASRVSNCKHAFLPQNLAIKGQDIGVENASSEAIREAIRKARPIEVEASGEFTREELLALGFIGGEGSRERRQALGSILGIGYSNSKQLVNRLNNFGISRQEFNRAVERIGKNEG